MEVAAWSPQPRSLVSTTRTWRPIPLERRTWGIYNYASLWVAMSVCIPTYMLASGLIAGGMSWWQAIGTILLGNLIVLVPMLLNAHAGTKYGIPFPGFRASLLRCAWRKRSRRSARAGRLRMVRHPNLDRRPGDLRHAGDPVARRSRTSQSGNLDLLLRLLGC